MSINEATNTTETHTQPVRFNLTISALPIELRSDNAKKIPKRGKSCAFENQPENPNSYSMSYQFSINWKNRYICIIPISIQNFTASNKN
jgi:hypothetical protein